MLRRWHEDERMLYLRHRLFEEWVFLQRQSQPGWFDDR